MNPSEQRVFDLVRSQLKAEYVPVEYRGVVDSEYCGHCHHATIAMYNLLGGKAEGYKVRKAVDELGIKHYWLENAAGEIIDPTAEQYSELGRPFPYLARINIGVSHLKSKVAKVIIENVSAMMIADRTT
ncbi:hypothetical protein [Janthinobacterium agaricidamnosum]|uniref:hypothetical protein n=1 Tax=Janthinobacterium agaricidamnosum TaxID=55508 RepID=UPI001185B1B9|nr:hypothetical protein [Janthinobacterium agaricidamnosum]